MTDEAIAFWRDVRDEDSPPHVSDGESGSVAANRKNPERAPQHHAGFDDKRTHFLHTIIRTHVFQQASRRLLPDQPAEEEIAAPDAVEQFKKALYAQAASAETAVAETARAQQAWFADHAASVPSKLAFLESVARALGDDWSRDAASFVEVTMAMGRLQLAMRNMMLASAADWAMVDRGSALIAVPPGEQHHFGQCIVEELFRARGWSTDLSCPSDEAELIGRIDRGAHDIVCLSWSTDVLTDAVNAAIGRIDSMPAARRPAIIAGGPASTSHGGWLVRLGVDCICDSTYGALAVAQAMLDQRDAVGTAASPLPGNNAMPVST